MSPKKRNQPTNSPVGRSPPIWNRLSSSADPAQPLSGAPAMSEALNDIITAAPRPKVSSAEVLRAKVEAARQVAAAQKAEADRAAASGREPGPGLEKRDRAPSVNSASGPGKRAKNDQSAPAPDAMDTTGDAPAKIRQTSFEHLHGARILRCAIQIDGNQIIGNPFGSTSQGYELKVALDAGKYGQPSIGLNCTINKPDANTKGSDKNHSFALGWEPGVKIGGQWMMEKLFSFAAQSPPTAKYLERSFPQQIKKLCEEENNKKSASKLVCVAFKSNVHKTTEVDTNWALDVKSNDRSAVHANLKRMYEAKDSSYKVLLWFLCPTTTIEYWHTCCMGPLEVAVKEHTPPFHQYMDEDGKPMIDFNLPSIDTIGNGMYRRMPKKQEGETNVAVRRPVSYFNFPRTVTWNSIKSFHVSYGVPTVRDMQWVEGVNAPIAQGWHGVFIQRLPGLTYEGKNLQPPINIWKRSVQVGVRMSRDPATGARGNPPPLGSTVLFDFYNGNRSAGIAHETVQKNICVGRVDNLGGKAWLDRTGTDFCVIMTKPKHLALSASGEAMFDRSLQQAKLKVKVDHTSGLRDLEAFEKFCDEDFAPELLDRIRLAFWSDPSRISERTDLTQGPAHDRSAKKAKLYEKMITKLEESQSINASQRTALMAASKMHSRIAVIQGPPGAGKTLTLRNKLISLIKVGHKAVCVASSNVAVDTDAKAVWKGLTPAERKTYKCLRLETNGAEKAQRLAQVGYAAYTGEKGEEDKMPEYRVATEAEDNPAIRNALDSILLEFAARQDHAEKMLAQYDDINEAYKAIENYDAIKRSKVATGMTLGYRIWEITEADMVQAEKDCQAARAAMSSAELARQVASGEASVTNFDKSHKYKRCMINYMDKRGKISYAERVALQDEFDYMVKRVLGDTHILFTTASNCGGRLLDDNDTFVPTVIFCDEAGQISIPSLCVPLTTFTNWEGLFMFGDIKQLEPTSLSGQFNEFKQNGKMSPLALLAMKGFQNDPLDTQYRMAPACSKFPRAQFYDGRGFEDSEQVTIDNAIRNNVRDIFLRRGVQGDNNTGSEYVVIDVVNGCSRVELNGNSLVNHANADVILEMIDTMLRTKEIAASDIKVLCYYQGQRRVIRKMINETTWPKVIKLAIEISTVDAYQGRESQVVIVDTVAAKDNLKFQPRIESDDQADDEDDNGGEEYVRVGSVTAHVRNPNRLNLALTRGKDATLVVCQAAALTSAYKNNRGKQYNAVSNMVADAKERNCYLENDAEDTHLESMSKRAELGRQRVERERAEARHNDLAFIGRSVHMWRDWELKAFPAISAAPPMDLYRTRTGHTTRPIGNPRLIEEADAYDEQ